MTNDSTKFGKLKIGLGCPPGALVERDGELKVTAHGLGILAVDFAKSEGMDPMKAAAYVLETSERYKSTLQQESYTDLQAGRVIIQFLESAIMRIREVYLGSGVTGGAA
ncbi:hypothetical protein [Acetobacter cerevisiae]|uniref:hypothetical protein n=1 Tax=Acetobacter cerevisiae TaxID=178900 RepID=UPI0020A025E4|nr:hypothetical protein [Acetobacter cerevisiae]MCP1270566.1 hypothetical protein [Acetobacter cerevisiae]MCP1278520.1 hypothetical protein [Acetobacter cerevisiae]